MPPGSGMKSRAADKAGRNRNDLLLKTIQLSILQENKNGNLKSGLPFLFVSNHRGGELTPLAPSESDQSQAA